MQKEEVKFRHLILDSKDVGISPYFYGAQTEAAQKIKKT